MTSHEPSSREAALLIDGGGEEPAYESDSEGGTSALALRRRVASDVEEEDPGLNSGKELAYSDADDDNDDQGGPPDQDHEQEHEEEVGEEYCDDEEASGQALAGQEQDVSKDGRGDGEPVKLHEQDHESSLGGVIATSGGRKEGAEEENKQTAQPFVVPRAGAFYMHDDRFEFNGIARPRRNTGGRKLWEAKDERRWVHDRFEDLQLSEDSYGAQGGRGRGRAGRGQGQGRDQDARSMRGQEARLGGGRESRDHVGDDAVALPPRRARGRGRALRRARMDDYEFKEIKPTNKRGEVRASTPRAAAREPSGKPEEAASKRPTAASSLLNSESPPFFPTGAITQNNAGGRPDAGTSKGPEEKLTDRNAAQAGRPPSSSGSVMDNKRAPRANPVSLTRASSSPPSIVTLFRGSGAIGEREAARRQNVIRQKSNSMQKQQLVTAGPSSLLHQKHEGGTVHMVEQLSYSAAPQQLSRGNSVLLPAQMQQRTQTIIPQGQLPKGPPMQSQSLVSSINLSGQPGVESKFASQAIGNKLKGPTSQRETQATAVQEGRDSFMYGGGSLTNGLRSVGVALPGYSSQPQFGFPNSEVTWIPILAGTGSLGSNYGSSYLAVDNSSPAVYHTPQGTHAQQASHTPFPLSGRETSALQAATGSLVMPPTRPEADEFGQQRRRYSQMTFREERG